MEGRWGQWHHILGVVGEEGELREDEDSGSMFWGGGGWGRVSGGKKGNVG